MNVRCSLPVAMFELVGCEELYLPAGVIEEALFRDFLGGLFWEEYEGFLSICREVGDCVV